MSSSNQSVLERLFNLSANQTNVRTEIMAGLTTFLAMCYIIIVNPLILGETGMDMGAVFVATCIASAIGCFVMGFVGNYPIALAPGMGLERLLYLCRRQRHGRGLACGFGCRFHFRHHFYPVQLL